MNIWYDWSKHISTVEGSDTLGIESTNLPSKESDESVASALSDRASNDQATSDAWFVAQRWQSLDGEYRANYLRIASLVSFYVIHLLQHYRPLGIFESQIPTDRFFHVALTLIVATWLLMSLAIDFCLRHRRFPTATPFLTTGIDVALLTSILCLGGGQQSPLVFAYALILVLSAIRFNLRLVQATTAAVIFGYLILMVLGRWPDAFTGKQIGVVPRYAQCITLLTLGITGVMLGQMVRRVKIMAEHFASRLEKD